MQDYTQPSSSDVVHPVQVIPPSENPSAYDLRKRAREALAGKWGKAAVIGLLAMIFYAISKGSEKGPFFFAILGLALMPLNFSIDVAFLDTVRGGTPTAGRVFGMFQWHTYATVALRGLLLFGWALLLMIPVLFLMALTGDDETTFPESIVFRPDDCVRCIPRNRAHGEVVFLLHGAVHSCG